MYMVIDFFIGLLLLSKTILISTSSNLPQKKGQRLPWLISCNCSVGSCGYIFDCCSSSIHVLLPVQYIILASDIVLDTMQCWIYMHCWLLWSILHGKACSDTPAPRASYVVTVMTFLACTAGLITYVQSIPSSKWPVLLNDTNWICGCMQTTDIMQLTLWGKPEQMHVHAHTTGSMRQGSSSCLAGTSHRLNCETG